MASLSDAAHSSSLMMGADAGGETAGAAPMMFSSRKCPPAVGLEHSCELPFGFVWTPMAAAPVHNNNNCTELEPPPLSNEQKQHHPHHDFETSSPPPPIVCVTCLAYMNMYCQIVEKKKEQLLGESSPPSLQQSSKLWICPFCRGENVLLPCHENSSAWMQNQVLVSPTFLFRQPLLGLSSSAHNNNNNSTIPLPAPQVDDLTLVVVLDTNLPSNEAHSIGNVLQSVLLKNDSSKTNIHLGLILFGKNVSIYQLGAVASGILASCDTVRSHEAELFVMWEQQQQQRDRLYLSADATSGVNALLNCLAAQFGVPPDIDNNNNNNNMPPSRSSSSIDTDTETNPVKPKSRLELLKERKEARLRAKEQQQQEEATTGSSSGTPGPPRVPQSPWTAARARATAQQQQLCYRCTGEALQCAMDLAASAVASATATTTIRQNSRTARVLLFTNGCPNIGDASVVATSRDDDDDDDENDNYDFASSSASLRKTTSVAIDSLKLARASEYLSLVATAAAEGGMGIDVFCSGSSELGWPVYQSLVEPSGGYVLMHDTFASEQLLRNLTWIVQETHVSLAQLPVPNEKDGTKDSDTENSNPAVVSAATATGNSNREVEWAEGCTVDIRLSSFLSPTHLIGPGDLLPHPDGPLFNEEAAFDHAVQLVEENAPANRKKSTPAYPSLEMLDLSLTRIRLGRFDPRSTFSVLLRLNDFFQRGDAFAHVQGVVRYVDRDGQFLVTAVTTHRLAVAHNVGEFLDAVDEQVVPVLLAKEAVYRSMFGRDHADAEHPFLAPHVGRLDDLAYDAQQDLDNTIFRISGAFKLLSLEHGTRSIDLTEEGGIKAAGSSMDFAFPPELSDAVRRLYHLRRGPLLSPGPLQSMDDRAELRSLFVRLPLEDCLSMMAPALWSSGPLEDALARNGPLLEDVPPETLSLWENRIIAADYFHSLFVWSGSATLDPKYDVIRQQLQQFLLERSEGRFPMPNLHLVSQNDSMSRRFTALLAPAHGDPVEHQLAHNTALAQLSAQEHTKLNERFRFYNPDADPSFRKWFWEVASAASASQEEGVSLCD